MFGPVGSRSRKTGQSGCLTEVGACWSAEYNMRALVWESLGLTFPPAATGRLMILQSAGNVISLPPRPFALSSTEDLTSDVAEGDMVAFGVVYDRLAPGVFHDHPTPARRRSHPPRRRPRRLRPATAVDVTRRTARAQSSQPSPSCSSSVGRAPRTP